MNSSLLHSENGTMHDFFQERTKACLGILERAKQHPLRISSFRRFLKVTHRLPHACQLHLSASGLSGTWNRPKTFPTMNNIPSNDVSWFGANHVQDTWYDVQYAAEWTLLRPMLGAWARPSLLPTLPQGIRSHQDADAAASGRQMFCVLRA